jgi:uncharacterized SAM-binding protein YcdF (DUF218 family)
LKRLAIAALLAVLGWFAGVAALIIHEEPQLRRGEKADVAIVLGAAVRGDGTPSPVFEGRLEHAVSLYGSDVPRLIFTGGRGEGMRHSEADVARRWAMARGVPAAAIDVEARSRTTNRNLREAAALMRAKGLRSALVVSDPLHLPRAMRMARDLGLEARPSPTTTSRYRSGWTRMPFLLRESVFLTGYWLTGD